MYRPHPGIPIIRGGSLAGLKTFEIFKTLSGVDNLDPNLTINGVTETPIFRYKLGDANGTNLVPWGYGETLTLTGTPVPTYNDGSPLLGTNDDSCKFNGGGYYLDSSNTANQISTGDIVFEVIWKTTSSSGLYLGGTKNATYGFSCYVATGNRITFRIYDSGGNNYTVCDNLNLDNGWHHAMCFINRDEASTDGSRWYVNGIELGGAVDLSAISGSLTGSDFAIGALPSGSNPFDSNIAYMAAWTRSSWHKSGSDGPDEWAHIAKERFLKLTRHYPSKAAKDKDVIVDGDMEAVGTASWSALDATLSKDTTAPLYEGTQHLRVTSTGNSFFARQQVAKTGGWYRITGAARSDGTVVPVVGVGGGVYPWAGTTSTSWQEFDVYGVAQGDYIFFGSADNHPGVVDFDNVTVTLLYSMPTAATRAFAAYTDKVEGSVRKYYYCGGEMLRMPYRQDSSAVDAKGYLPETQNENLFTYSEAFTNWSSVDVHDTILDDQIAGPDGRTAASSITADADAGNHGVSLNPTLTAATYTFSVHAKPGDRDWIELDNQQVSNCSCFFDVANGTVGTAGAGATGYIEGPFLNGFYRCCIVFTGTAAPDTCRILVADGDNDTNVTGDASTVNTYLWGAQVEQSDYMTSPIITAGATATRLKDQLQFVGGDNIGGEDVGQGTVVCDILYPNYDCQDAKYLLNVSDGGASADRLFMYTATDDTQQGGTRATGGDNGSCAVAGDSVDNQKHSVRFIWETDNLRQAVDGTFGSADTTADMPDDLDVMDIGQNYVAGAQFNGLISNLRIYKKPIKAG